MIMQKRRTNRQELVCLRDAINRILSCFKHLYAKGFVWLMRCLRVKLAIWPEPTIDIVSCRVLPSRWALERTSHTDTFEWSLASLKPLGMMITFGNASGPIPPLGVGKLGKLGPLKITRPTLLTHIGDHTTCQSMLQHLGRKVLSGGVKIISSQRFALNDVAKAHEALEARKTTGSTILEIYGRVVLSRHRDFRREFGNGIPNLHSGSCGDPQVPILNV